MWTMNDHVWCDAAQKHNGRLIVFTNIHPLGDDQEPFGSMPFDQIPCTICIASDRIQFVLQPDFLYFCSFFSFYTRSTDSSIIVCSTWLSFMSLSYLFIGIIYTVQFCLTQRSTKTKRYLKQLPNSGSHLVTIRKFNLPRYVIYKLPNTTSLLYMHRLLTQTFGQWTDGGLNALKHYYISNSVTWFYLPFFLFALIYCCPESKRNTFHVSAPVLPNQIWCYLTTCYYKVIVGIVCIVHAFIIRSFIAQCIICTLAAYGRISLNYKPVLL